MRRWASNTCLIAGLIAVVSAPHDKVNGATILGAVLVFAGILLYKDPV